MTIIAISVTSSFPSSPPPSRGTRGGNVATLSNQEPLSEELPEVNRSGSEAYLHNPVK